MIQRSLHNSDGTAPGKGEGGQLTAPIRTARAAPHPPLCTQSGDLLFLDKTDRQEYFVEFAGLTNFSRMGDVTEPLTE